MKVLRSHLSVFSDTPSRTTTIEHDIEVGDALPVRQRASRLPVEKRQRMEKMRWSICCNIMLRLDFYMSVAR